MIVIGFLPFGNMLCPLM